MAARRKGPAVPAIDGDALNEQQDERDAVEIFDGPPVPGLPLYIASGDMAALSDAGFGDWEWWIYRIRSAAEMAEQRTRESRVLYVKLTGPLDITEVMRTVGGGVFEIRGFYEHIMRTRIRREFFGPVKVVEPERSPIQSVTVAPVAAAPSVPLAGEALELRRALRRQRRDMQELRTLVATRLAAPVAAAAPVVDPMAQLTAVLEVADRIHANRNPAPEANVLGEVVSAFKQGMGLAREIEGAPEKTTTEQLIEHGVPMVERLFGTFLASRGRPMTRTAPPPPPAREPSSAQVIDPPAVPPGTPPAPPASAPPVASSGEHRWTTAVEALARSIEAGDDPSDFALTLEAILLPAEIGLLRFAGADAVLEKLRERAGGRFPVLTSDAALPFVVAVKAALEGDDSEDDPEDPAGDGSGV